MQKELSLDFISMDDVVAHVTHTHVNTSSTGRQGVCVVVMETPASGQSGPDPGSQFGRGAVSRFPVSICKL